MNIRFAQSRDKKQVLQLLNELGEVMNDLVSFDPDNVKAHMLGSNNFDSVIKSKTVRLFVIEEKGIVYGIASFYILVDMITGQKFAHIDDVVVKKEYRGRGIGSELMAYVLSFAERTGFSCVKLTTSLPLTDAHRFYEKLGGKFSQRVYKFTF